MSCIVFCRSGTGHELKFKLVPDEKQIKYLKTVAAFANREGGKS